MLLSEWVFLKIKSSSRSTSLLFLNVIKRQHQRQVVHVDLYPSNVLWDLLGDSNRNRIVNWDTATFFGYAM